MSEQFGLREYQPGYDADMIAARWYQRLVQTQDLFKVFPPHAWIPSGFLSYLRSVRTFWKVENGEVYFSAIMVPWFGGCQYDMWVAPEKRQSKSGLKAVLDGLHLGFHLYGTLIGFTSQVKLIPGHEKLGYKKLCHIPKFWDKEKDCHMLYITKELFDAKREKWGGIHG